MREEEDETGRRIVSIVHVAMLAAVPLYAVILLFVAGNASPATIPGKGRIVWVLLAIGAAEWGAASLLGRAFLRARRPGSGASDRIRRYFLIRFAAAEAIGVFGLFAGFSGSPLREAGLLFATSALALVLSSPTRTAWARAFALAQGEKQA